MADEDDCRDPRRLPGVLAASAAVGVLSPNFLFSR
jgi:hypothetical protein